MINITKTYLPNKKKYKGYIDKIYKSGWITNDGPLVKELENRLADYLGVKNIVLVSSGTSALELAYRSLDLEGYVITTPFSFVATTSSLITNGLKPIFVDIDKNTLNIDTSKIEESITPNTSAILPVHVFGNACDIKKIKAIAKKYKLKVIYDAAHTFGVNKKGESILKQGNISTMSFHATKLFHSIEGGALIINDDALVEKARYLRNFGIESPESIPELGSNAKMNEFEAAMGLCVLDDIQLILSEREEIDHYYQQELNDFVQVQKMNKEYSKNYSYYPIILKSNKEALKINNALNKQKIFPRRYFYPSLDSLPYIEPKQYCKTSRNISNRILSLPIYPGLAKKDQTKIINIIKSCL